MTHRSRNGGPSSKPKQKSKTGRKLHHPPDPTRSSQTSTASIEDPESDDGAHTLPASVLLDSPTDCEILEVIHHALRDTLDSPSFVDTVQHVKQLLYDRKWLEVFGNSGLLDVYAGRWVPSRALCYRHLFASLKGVRELFSPSHNTKGTEQIEAEDAEEDEEVIGRTMDKSHAKDAEIEKRYILSLGGGASSELLAVAALIKSAIEAAQSTLADHTTSGADDASKDEDALEDDDSYSEDNEKEPVQGRSPVKWNWTAVDIGSWSRTINKIAGAINSEWDLSDNLLQVDFKEGSLLSTSTQSTLAPTTSESKGASTDTPPSSSQIDLDQLFFHPPRLITILFTLTELLTQSRPQTITLLKRLTQLSTPGTILLVADSASDISNFGIGTSGRSYPAHMILDLVLGAKSGALARNKPQSDDFDGKWECLRSEDSKWYRLPEGVGSGWPVKLENTRYWLRVYRRR